MMSSARVVVGPAGDEQILVSRVFRAAQAAGVPGLDHARCPMGRHWTRSPSPSAAV
jgi:hypothetical protein